MTRSLILIISISICISCKTESGKNTELINKKPHIEPDYTELTIPPNIAPLNFRILEDDDDFRVLVTSENDRNKIDINSSDGVIRFPERKWKTLVNNSKGSKIKIQIYSSTKESNTEREYEPIIINVAKEPIDQYITYRLIPPGYYSWSELSIKQRSLENFKEKSILENVILDMNCINCHSFNQYSANRFMVHIRGSKGGTYFVENGKITKNNLKIESMPGGATYPTWHPGGRYLAFSSNQVRQTFYSIPEKSIEVYDLVSSLILYDRQNNEIFDIPENDTTKYLLTFPYWSADGKYLYYCRAEQKNPDDDPGLDDIKSHHYNIARKSFNESNGSFGETEVLFDAASINKSASFPRVSPDGRYLIFTLHDYGTFPIWHKEADLYIMNLTNGDTRKMNLNSDETDSYHSWSSNSRWLIFSSKRSDGRSTRFYISYIDSTGHSNKPFILPQKDPDLYMRMLESFNIPEFTSDKIDLSPRDFAKATKQEAIQALKGNPLDSLPKWAEDQAKVKIDETDRPIHQ